MASKKCSTSRKTSIIPMDELEEVNGHMVDGELTSRINAMIMLVFAYTSSTYKVLKKEKCRDMLC